MALTPADVSRIAELARLELSGAEADAMLAQLNDFFGIVEQMSAVDTAGVEPLYSPVTHETPLRADVAAHAWDRVAPFAHTLKGRAGLLGMGEISAIAGRLEAAAHAGDFVRAERLLIALEAHLRPLVEGLARALPASAGDGDPIASASCPEHSVSAGS